MADGYFFTLHIIKNKIQRLEVAPDTDKGKLYEDICRHIICLNASSCAT